MDTLKALIPVEATLESNVALRFICNMAGTLRIAVRPINIREPGDREHNSETGWARKSWECRLRQSGQDEIKRILKGEGLEGCTVPAPIIRVGAREDEILDELRQGGHDLFVTGEAPVFNPGECRRIMRPRLYRQMPCPAMVVRNMTHSGRVVLLLDMATDAQALVDYFCRLFNGQANNFDLCAYALDDLRRDPDELLDRGERLLKERGLTPARAFTLLGAPESAARALSGYGLLATHVDRAAGRGPLMDTLGLATCPILACW